MVCACEFQRHRSRIFRYRSVIIKLHLGSGKRRLKGFTQIDIEPGPYTDIVSDISQLEAISDLSVEEIYSSHSFEYFDAFQAIDVLAEWKRVLIPGGRLYLSVPDFQKLIQIYLEGQNLGAIIGPLFGRWKNTESGETLYHRTTWDWSSLRDCLISAGFKNVQQFDPVVYLESIDKDYDDFSLAYFPHMDRRGIQLSLCVTAVA